MNTNKAKSNQRTHEEVAALAMRAINICKERSPRRTSSKYLRMALGIKQGEMTLILKYLQDMTWEGGEGVHNIPGSKKGQGYLITSDPHLCTMEAFKSAERGIGHIISSAKKMASIKTNGNYAKKEHTLESVRIVDKVLRSARGLLLEMHNAQRLLSSSHHDENRKIIKTAKHETRIPWDLFGMPNPDELHKEDGDE